MAHAPGVPCCWGAALLGCHIPWGCAPPGVPCSLGACSRGATLLGCRRGPWLLHGLESGLTSAPSAWLPCDSGSPRSYARGSVHVCDPEVRATFTVVWAPLA